MISNSLHNLLRLTLLGLLLLNSSICHALDIQWTDFQLSFGLGLGGAGIATMAPISTGTTTSSTGVVTPTSSLTAVNRSEGPGMAELSLEYLLSDRFTVGVSHERGFRLGPFSSGESFTGVFGRWYPLIPAPTVAKEPPSDATSIFIRRLAPFVGLALGIATADIKRDQDLVPEVNGSGIYMGIRVGVDYPLTPGMGLRPEFVYSSTFVSTTADPATLGEYSLQCAIYFFL